MRFVNWKQLAPDSHLIAEALRAVKRRHPMVDVTLLSEASDPSPEELFGKAWPLELDELKTPGDWNREVESAYSNGYEAACRQLNVPFAVELIETPNGFVRKVTAKVPA